MAQTVVGMFDTAEEATQAVQSLTSKGFLHEDIDVSNSSENALGSTNVSGTTETSTYAHDETKNENGFTRFFKNLFSSDDDSEKYVNVASRSGSVVTVHAKTAEQAEEAADILDDCGAVNVDERAASYGYVGAGFTSNTPETFAPAETATYSTPNTGAYTSADADEYPAGDTTTNLAGVHDITSPDDATKINVIEENLQVGKREVLTGGVRLRSRIVERPVEETLRLKEEFVRIDRTPVNRVATNADLANFTATDIEMTETAEVPVITKEARVVEEITLDKEVEERTETISETVRKTEVDVEDIDGDSVSKKY